ncbi:hypothetical protein Droror1_Dr00014831 [Drosera rotundifolia]
MASDSSSPENIIHTITTTTISPTGTSLPTQKPSHFLNPIISPQTLPVRPSVPLPKRPIYLYLSFNGWPLPRTHSSPLWAQWVYTMKEKHHQVWRKSGILEAVMGSVVRVCRDEEVLLGVMERWCPETNTFVFPWGEATVTLEDVIVLGGYPVIGDGIWSQYGGRNEDEVVIGKLVQAHRVISRGTAQKAYHGLWMKEFMGRETGIEHEAFLACWLSRFVFPVFPFGVVNKRMFRMAVCLARGDQVALGPIVLASVYRDLGLLKSTMDAAAVMEEWREDEKGSVLALTVWAPLQLVQVWFWERFVELRPNPWFWQDGTRLKERMSGM